MAFVETMSFAPTAPASQRIEGSNRPSDERESALMASAHEALRTTFGFSGFRGTQEAVIARVLRAERTLALMPTGAGKSLCYQIPALVRDGTVIVVRPSLP